MLEVKNMVKTFFKGTINEKTALQGINLRLEEGDFCTVIVVMVLVKVLC